MLKWCRRLIAFIFIVFYTTPLSADTRYDRFFVKPDWLLSHIGQDMIILDARGDWHYKRGHIPGALPIHWKQLVETNPNFGHMYWGSVSSINRVNTVLSDLGITHHSKIIIYSNTRKGWGEDGRIFWTLKMAGLEHIRILDGGIHGWKDAGGGINRKRPKVVKSNFVAKHRERDTTIDTKTLKHEYHSYKLIDTRTLKEFNGAIKFGEKRGGHLPGAAFIPYKDFLENGFLKPLGQLEKMLILRGINKSDQIVTYCTSGIRSAHVQVVLEMLGYPSVKNYDESFYIWASDPANVVVK